MTTIKVEYQGFDELGKKLDKGTVDKSTKEPFTKLVLETEALAKKSTVVDTGRLRASITHQIYAISAEIGTNVQYAPFIEFGTIKMQSRHMEGSTKVLGQGMFDYTVEQLAEPLEQFNVSVTSNFEKEIEQ